MAGALHQRAHTNISRPEGGTRSPAQGPKDMGKPMADTDSFTAEEALEHIGFGPVQWLTFLGCGLVWSADAMSVMLMSFLGPSARCEFGIGSGGEAALGSVVFAGMLVGCPCWGAAADVYGRRRTVLASTIFTAVCGLLSCVAVSFHWLVVARAGVGFGLAGVPAAFTLFMEWVPPSQRGHWMVGFNIWWTIGSIVEGCLAWALVNTHGWRVLLAASTAPQLLLVALFPLLPDSPEHLVALAEEAAHHNTCLDGSQHTHSSRHDSQQAEHMALAVGDGMVKDAKRCTSGAPDVPQSGTHQHVPLYDGAGSMRARQQEGHGEQHLSRNTVVQEGHHKGDAGHAGIDGVARSVGDTRQTERGEALMAEALELLQWAARVAGKQLPPGTLRGHQQHQQHPAGDRTKAARKTDHAQCGLDPDARGHSALLEERAGRQASCEGQHPHARVSINGVLTPSGHMSPHSYPASPSHSRTSYAGTATGSTPAEKQPLLHAHAHAQQVGIHSSSHTRVAVKTGEVGHHATAHSIRQPLSSNGCSAMLHCWQCTVRWSRPLLVRPVGPLLAGLSVVWFATAGAYYAVVLLVSELHVAAAATGDNATHSDATSNRLASQSALLTGQGLTHQHLVSSSRLVAAGSSSGSGACTGPGGMLQLPTSAYTGVMLAAAAELPSVLLCLCLVGRSKARRSRRHGSGLTGQPQSTKRQAITADMPNAACVSSTPIDGLAQDHSYVQLSSSEADGLSGSPDLGSSDSQPDSGSLSAHPIAAGLCGTAAALSLDACLRTWGRGLGGGGAAGTGGKGSWLEALTIDGAALWSSRMFIAAAFTLLYIYTPLLLQPQVRGRALGVLSSISRVGALCAPLLVVPLVQAHQAVSALLLLAVLCGTAVVAVLLVERRARS